MGNFIGGYTIIDCSDFYISRLEDRYIHVKGIYEKITKSNKPIIFQNLNLDKCVDDVVPHNYTPIAQIWDLIGQDNIVRIQYNLLTDWILLEITSEDNVKIIEI